MNTRTAVLPFLAVATLAVAPAPLALAQHKVMLSGDGIIRVRSAYSINETIARIKQDIAAKGILFFSEVDQAKLAANAGVKLNPSTLLTFGNPPLGTQFITANPNAALDWPVRLVVQQDDKGHVYAVYTDFAWIAKRHGITDREAQFRMASSVVASITSTIRAEH